MSTFAPAVRISSQLRNFSHEGRKGGRGGNFLVDNFCDLLKQERKSQRRKLRKWTTTAVVTAADVVVAAVAVAAAPSKLTPTKHIETQFIL